MGLHVKAYNHTRAHIDIKALSKHRRVESESNIDMQQHRNPTVSRDRPLPVTT